MTALLDLLPPDQHAAQERLTVDESDHAPPPAGNFDAARRPATQLTTPQPHKPAHRIPVSLISTDVISRAGVISQLRPRPEVRLLDDAEADHAQVTLVVADGIDDPTLRNLRALHVRATTAIVLVVSHIDDAGMLAAAEHGAAGIARRSEASADRLVTMIRAAAAGDGSLPPDLLGRLLKQVGTLQKDILAPRGLVFNGLHDREVNVLRLIADGYDTTQIAEKLCYSPRTIKNILHDITNRFHLRNRCHAVAFALRNGLI